MDLKELGDAMAQALTLRGMVDSIDERIATKDAQIKANQVEIAGLKRLEEITARAIEDKKSMSEERGKNQGELNKRLEALAAVGVTLPIAQKFSGGGTVRL